VDFLDEKTFARLAASKARAGRDIVRSTYRLHFTQDSAGQWQGYTDGADPARAWGVSEWAHRSGQGAYFDWVVANALLPDQASSATPVTNPENLDFIERSAAEDEIGEVASGLHEIQTAMDEANNGCNPLGFSSDAIAFDIDPTYLAVGSTAQIGTRAVQGLTHFEQIYERALISGKNALEALRFATNANNKLRHLAGDTDAMIIDSLRQDLDYRNRLIEIFGRPYTGTIGFGKAYPEGYEGPDTMLYAYLDKTTIDKIVPQISTASKTVTFDTVYTDAKGAMDNTVMVDLYNRVWGSTASTNKLKDAFETLKGDNFYQLETRSGPLTAPYTTASKYGFQASADWGQRTSYGRAQRALEEMLLAEIGIDQSISDYIGYLQDWEAKAKRLQSELALFEEKTKLGNHIVETRAIINTSIVAAETAIGIAQAVNDFAGPVAKTIKESLPRSVGLSSDVTSFARGIAFAAAEASSGVFNAIKNAKDIAKSVLELTRDETIASLERDISYVEQVSALEGLVEELVNLSGGDQPKRDTIGMAVQEMELKRQEYTTSLAEGFRLLREREAFNKVLASKTQKNRYQDMIVRISRNEVMAKYQSAFNLAARYTWLAAKAYDYETSLDPGHPAAATQLYDKIVKARQLGLWPGLWPDGTPVAGQGGLAEVLALLNGNFQTLEGQIGLNSVQIANEDISMRAEHFRIHSITLDPAVQAALDTPVGSRSPAQTALIAASQETISQAAASDGRWQDALKDRMVDDLWQVPEFRMHCRPFAAPSAGPQPGLVIRFSSVIEPGQNFFGRPLGAGDHAYSSANFATRIATAGVFLDGYSEAGLAATPRAYLIPVGTDYFRVSTATNPFTRGWSVKDTRVPTPFVMNQSQMSAPGFIPSLDGIDGSYGEVRRHADFRVYHGDNLNADGDLDVDDDEQSTRLIARSIWNSEWLLIIPGAGLYGDATTGLERFADHVSDIKLNFKTYSHNGQ
jgi:leucyl aminopeptidase (aminopeptidase T)